MANRFYYDMFHNYMILTYRKEFEKLNRIDNVDSSLICCDPTQDHCKLSYFCNSQNDVKIKEGYQLEDVTKSNKVLNLLAFTLEYSKLFPYIEIDNHFKAYTKALVAHIVQTSPSEFFLLRFDHNLLNLRICSFCCDILLLHIEKFNHLYPEIVHHFE